MTNDKKLLLQVLWKGNKQQEQNMRLLLRKNGNDAPDQSDALACLQNEKGKGETQWQIKSRIAETAANFPPEQ